MYFVGASVVVQCTLGALVTLVVWCSRMSSVYYADDGSTNSTREFTRIPFARR